MGQLQIRTDTAEVKFSLGQYFCCRWRQKINLQKEYGEQIEILAGSGLNAQNVQDLIRKTNVKQIHSSCKGWLPDMTTCSEDVSFSYRAKEKDACREAIVGDYEVVDVVLVRKFINMVTCELTFEIEKEDEEEGR